MSNIRIQKRDGSLSVLDISKIQKQTKDATADLEGVSQSELEIDAQIKFVDMMKSSDIEDSLIKTAVEKIDIDRPNWTFVAARLFVYDLYHKVGKAMKGEKGKPYAPISKYYEIGEKEEKLHVGVSLKYDLERIDAAIAPERDFLFNYLGIKTLYDRYLIKNSKKEPIELPQHMFMALSMFLAQEEKYFPTHEEALKYSHLKVDSPEYEKAAKTSWAIEFYNLISKFEVMLATPTLSNGRTNRHQLSSCYIGSNFDNIEGIFDAYKEKALLSKFGGGIGWDWTKIRAMKDAIAGHSGAAGGYIPFLKIENDLAIAVDQLGCVAENTYVEVLHTVTTNHGIHDFRKEYVKIDLSERERIENIAGFASSFAFEYAKFSKNLISSLLFDYIVNTKDHHFLYTLYGMSKEQYKKIINKYKKINKGLPVGFRILEDHKEYAISDDGIVIYLKTLKPLSQQIDRKGYTRITIGKNSVALHKLLVKTFLNFDTKNLTVDHIDENKQNNNLDNFKIISNEENISKSWGKNSDLRKEKIKLKAHFSHGKNLNGRRTSAGNETVIEEITTKRILIGQVRSGDLIKSYNVKTGEIEYKDVLSVYDINVKEENQIKLVYSNGNYIVTSLWHPTLIKVNGQFTYIRADETNIGDIALDSNNQEVNVVDIVLNPGYSSNYKDLTVKDNNNYFASTDKKDGEYHLIHNTRKGAIAVYSETWHMDILDFLDLKKNSGEERRRTHDLFPALWISDLFMKRVEENGKWTLFSPNNVPLLTETYGEEFEKAYIAYENDETIPKQVLNAKEIWKKVLTQYFETGNPFLGFKDTANRANPNPHTGHIRSSNLCMEIFQNTSSDLYKIKIELLDGTIVLFDEEEYVEIGLNKVKKAKHITALDTLYGQKIFIVEKEKIDGETAVCNLGSVNLSKINSKEDLARVIPIAIRMLDNVIDLNFYPLRKVKVTNLKTRAIGLGVMGEAQMLAEKGILYASQEHLNLMDEIMDDFSYHTILASSKLAEEKGSYPTFKGSNWEKGIMPFDHSNELTNSLVSRSSKNDWLKVRETVRKNGIRNGYLMAIAPTSSISILVGTTQAIEPVYKKKWFEENLSGLIPVVVPNLSPDTWNYYPSAYDVDPFGMMRVGAVRQKWIDQGQSLNMFLKLENVTGKMLNDLYTFGWKLGLKSNYYLRSQSPDAKKAEMAIADRKQECEGCQ